MNLVRTTISLPADLHQELRLLAIKKKKSLGELVTQKFRKRPLEKKKKERIKEDFLFFDKVARFSIVLDAAKAVREEREKGHG